MTTTDAASTGSTTSDLARKHYVMGVQNAHALEKQATQLINRQLERIESYPEVAALLRQHLDGTVAQIQRLDGILEELGAGPSLVKDLATQMSGNITALAHAVMSDEVMKNHFANVAFEAFEQATYRSLIAMAQATGFANHAGIYESSLSEEERTFSTLLGITDRLTARYLQLSASGEQAKR